jgi:hypothetical protein
MGCNLDAYLFSGCLDAGAHQIWAQRSITVEKDVAGRPHSTHDQVFLDCPDRGVGQIDCAILPALASAHDEAAFGQAEVFQAQFLDLTYSHPTLPEQVEASPIEQGVASLAGRASLSHTLL